MRFVCSLTSRRFTGLLHVSSGEKRLTFSFRDGELVFVEEKRGGVFRSEDSVAQELVRRRVLTVEQYTSVVERMEGISTASVDASFCDIAVRLGYLDPQQVFASFSERIRSKLMEAVSWRQCELSVDDSPAALSGHEQYPVTPGPLLYQAIRASFDQQRIFACTSLHPESAIRLRYPAESVGDRFSLSQEEMRLLRACDGMTPLALVVDESGLDPEHAWQIVCLLDLSGSLQPADRHVSGTSSAPAEESKPVQEDSWSKPVSAVEKLAVDLEMRRAAESQSTASGRPATSGGATARPRKFSTTSRQMPAMENLARELMKRGSLQPPSMRPRSPSPRPAPVSVTPPATTARPGRRDSDRSLKRSAPTVSGSNRPGSNRPGSNRPGAVRTGSDRPPGSRSIRPPAGDGEGLSAERAVTVFESGRDYLRAKDFESARDEFLLAHELEPRQGVYRMYYLWAALRAEHKGGPVGRYPEELKRLAHSHTCIHGHIGFAYFILGQLALSDGNESQAEKHFKDAIENDVNMPEAERQYRLLLRRRERR